MHAAQQIQHTHYHNPVRKTVATKRKALTPPRVKTRNRVYNSYVRETCALLLCVLGLLGLNLFLLSRYAEITSAKHQVHVLDNTLEQLQNQKVQLSVKIDKSSRLDWIEDQAVERLAMKYPDKSQVIFISVDPNRVALINESLARNRSEVRDNSLLPHSIERIFHKFAGVLQI